MPRSRARSSSTRPTGKPLKDDLHGVRPPARSSSSDGEPCDLSRWSLARTARCSRRRAAFASRRAASPASAACCSTTEMLDGVRILSPNRSRPCWRRGVALTTAATAQRDARSATPAPTAVDAGTIPNPGRLRRRCPDAGATRSSPCRRCLWHESGLWIDRCAGRGIAFISSAAPDDSAEASALHPAESAAFRRTYALLAD